MPEEAVIENPPAPSPEELAADQHPAETQPKPQAKPEPAVPFGDLIRKKVEEKEQSKEAAKEKKEAPKAAAKKRKEEAAEGAGDVDPLRLAEAQGRELAKTLANELRPREAPKEKERVPDLVQQLPEEYRKDAEVYAQMEQLFPEKHGQLLKKLKSAADKETARIAEWEEKNPGEEYDPDSQEHQGFYKKTFPDIPEADFEAAKEAVIEARIASKIEEKYRTALEKLERSSASERLAPVAAETIGSMIGEALGEMDAGLKDAASSPEALKELEDQNPVAAEVVSDVYRAYSPLLLANLRVHRGAERFDAQNPAHLQLFEVAQDIERQTAQAPWKDRMDAQGRMFASREQYAAMGEAERAKHWIVDEEVIRYVLTRKAAKFAKSGYAQRQAQFEKWLKSKGLNVGSESDSSPKGGRAGSQEMGAKPKAASSSEVSPAVPGSGQVPSPWGQGNSGTKKPGDYFLDYLKRR